MIADSAVDFHSVISFGSLKTNVMLVGQSGRDNVPLPLPLFLNRISAGFASPADDYLEAELSLDQHLIKNPDATFFLRVQGDSMVGAGIHDGDMLIVDRSLNPRHNNVVIAEILGDLTVKRLFFDGANILLLAENPNYKPIIIREESQLVVWGVVTNVIHSLA